MRVDSEQPTQIAERIAEKVPIWKDLPMEHGTPRRGWCHTAGVDAGVTSGSAMN